MGRGRGKGKKPSTVRNHEDPGSGGEEVLPTYKRRGRPQKPLKEDIDEEEGGKVEKEEVEEGDDVKPTSLIKENKNSVENGKKRKRNLQVKESSDSVIEEDNSSLKSNGFRQNGSRRKSKPRRAAEAGVECK
ncbi:uncharacterized protein LOC109711881 [Ananas comosus]|uniref:Uncharacterized protein LOC109711881 n=2 Tax=Ananas comosus TaxID=4615 RepID=A0A199W517_ANACO|nr:uncharacterized protein LOC109711881 [Ananas comosus]XP_020090819.1 uncharacterized protein LOC109711881 [Ananas comosus]OAY84341.1 hypothetical protein ACMD2_14078 [Ananas comosus]